MTIRPYRSERPRIRGLQIKDSRGLRIVGLTVTDQTEIERSSRITVSDADISPHGIHIYSGTRLTFKRNRIHDLTMRISSATGRCIPPRCGYAFRIHQARKLTIKDNLMRNIPGDGIQSGPARRYLIAGNEFENVNPFVDRAEHSDAIQLYRGSRGVKIVGNYFHDTRGPLIGNPETREPHRRLVIANNLIVDQRDWGLKAYDTPGLRLVNNTVWDARLGVVLANQSGSATRRVRAFNNIIDRLEAKRRFFRVEDHNLIGTGFRRGSHDLARLPRFRARRRLDYRLVGSSPGIDTGRSRGAPRRDRLGHKRVDAAGVPNTGKGRRYFDLGAHEFAGRFKPPKGSYAARVRSEPGLLAYWRLGDRHGSLILDAIGRLVGRLVGAVEAGVTGAIRGDSDTAVRLSGAGRIEAPDAASAPVDDFTVEGWMKLVAGASGNHALFGDFGSMRLITRPSGYYAGVWLAGREHFVQGVTKPNTGRWVHWAFMRSGPALLVYRNGDEVGHARAPGDKTANLTGSIGAIGTAYPAAAAIDEVALYECALSADAVRDHQYLATHPRAGDLGPEPGPPAGPC